MVMYCPYCDIEINEKQLEAEDGCCPECGAFISPGLAVEGEDDDENEGGDGEEDEFSDEFGDDDGSDSADEGSGDYDGGKDSYDR